MKIFLLIISMIGLINCYGWKDPDDSPGSPGPDINFETEIIDTYVGIAIIKMECGDLCEHPMIRAYSMVDPYVWDFFADSTGTIFVEYGVKHSGELGDFERFEVTAFMDSDSNDVTQHQHLIQYPYMLFKNIDVTDHDIPITEVIFSDSLAANKIIPQRYISEKSLL